MTESAENTQSQETEVTVDGLVSQLDGKPELVNDLLSNLVTDDFLKQVVSDETKLHIIQPQIDRAVSKGVESYKRNNFDIEVEKAISERFPAESPEQVENRKLQERLASLEKENQRESMRNFAMNVGAERQLDPKFVSFIMGDTQEETRSRANMLAMEIDAMVEKGVESRLKATGQVTKPQGGASAGNHSGVLDKPASEYTMKERSELYVSNRAKYDEMFA